MNILEAYDQLEQIGPDFKEVRTWPRKYQKPYLQLQAFAAGLMVALPEKEITKEVKLVKKS